MKVIEARILAVLIILMTSSETSAMSILQAWQAAARYDPEFLSAVAARDATEESAEQAGSLFMPKVQLQASTSWAGSKTDVTLPDQFQSLGNARTSSAQSTGTIQINLPLYDAQSSARAVYLRKRTESGRAAYTAQDQRLMERVAEAAFDLMSTEASLKLIRAQKAVFQEEKQRAQKRFDLGNAKITDLRETQAQLDQLSASEITLLAQKELAIANFKEITANDPVRITGVKASFQAASPKLTLQEWQEIAELNAPSVIVALRNLETAKASIDQYRWSGRPTVSAIGSYSGLWNHKQSASILNPAAIQGYTFGVQVTVPLETGGLYPSELREAQANFQKAQHDLDIARRNVRLSIHQSWLGVSTGVSRILALRTAVESAELQQGAAILGREVGSRTQADVLTAHSLVFSSLKNLNLEIYEYQKNRLKLAASAGQLDPDLLALIDQDLEPDV